MVDEKMKALTAKAMRENAEILHALEKYDKRPKEK
jgi:hypothetical protein